MVVIFAFSYQWFHFVFILQYLYSQLMNLVNDTSNQDYNTNLKFVIKTKIQK